MTDETSDTPAGSPEPGPSATPEGSGQSGPGEPRGASGAPGGTGWSTSPGGPAGPPGGGEPWGAPGAWGSAPLPPPYFSGPGAADRIRAAWQGRGDTDYIFNFWTALGWTVLTFGIYGLYVFYQLMRRMRDHNARRLELLDAAMTFGWEEAGRRGLQDELTPSFQRASAHIGALRNLTTQFRDPVIWLLLSIVAGGLVHLIAFIFLDQDLVNHDRAEVGVEYELAVIYGRLGQQLAFPQPDRVKRPHNYVGRVVATVFSFGIYFLWWFYDMMEDANRHFQLNWAQEDALAAAVQSLH